MASHAISVRLAALTFTSAAIVALFGCAPSPRYAPCSNDGDCAAAGERHPYCMQNRCVECVSRASCGGNACNDGICQIACKDKRDCRGEDACEEGFCRPPG